MIFLKDWQAFFGHSGGIRVQGQTKNKKARSRNGNASTGAIKILHWHANSNFKLSSATRGAYEGFRKAYLFSTLHRRKEVQEQLAKVMMPRSLVPDDVAVDEVEPDLAPGLDPGPAFLARNKRVRGA